MFSASRWCFGWQRALRAEYQADDGYFGAGSSPVVLEDRIIVNVGGKKGGVVAVQLKDGKTLWTATEYEASYAAPILIGTKKSFVVVPTRLKTVAIDVRDGRVLWEIPFGQRGPTVNAATPIALSKSKLFLTASYGIGSIVLEANEQAGKVVKASENMSSQYASPVLPMDFSLGVMEERIMATVLTNACTI